MNWKFDCKRTECTAFLSALICGSITHLFGLVNVLSNIDDIAQQPYGYGTGISSGRWLLTLLGDLVGKLGGNYNLPLFNGLLFLFLLSASAGIVVSVFQIKNRTSAALMGTLFVTLPSVASTMFFRYTTVYYGISVLMAVLSVWVLERYRLGILASAVLLACSMGIYQAYAPLAISLYLLLLIRQGLKGQTDLWPLIRRGLFYCSALIAGLALYYVLLKLFLSVYGTELSDYNGVNEMGKLSLTALPGLIKKTVYYFIMLPVKNYCSLANSAVLRLCYLLLGTGALVMIGWRLLNMRKDPLLCLAVLVLCCLFPVAVNFILIMCPGGYIYTLMVYPFVLVGCFPLILLEDVPAGKISLVLQKTLLTVIALLAISHAYDTNVEYTSLYYSNRQTENYLNAMVVQVRMTEGFDTEKQWAFLGQIQDPLLRTPWQYEVRYGGNEPAEMMINRGTRYDWFLHYFGYSIPMADEQTIAELWEQEEVKQMPSWPNEGSVKVIGDVVVIKCGENP